MDINKILVDARAGAALLYTSENLSEAIIAKVLGVKTSLSELAGIITTISTSEDLEKTIITCDAISATLDFFRASRGVAAIALISCLFASLDSLEDFLVDNPSSSEPV